LKPLTIVLVTYGGLQDTIRCLDTLANTDYEFDVIIVDNNSSEAVCEFLNEYSKQELYIRVIYLRKNVGVFAAKAIGMTLVETKYMCYIHQDMYFQDPKWLKSYMDAYQDGTMLLINQYYSDRPEKRAMVCGFLLYAYIMDTATYGTCPVDHDFHIYLADLEHQVRFIQTYGKEKWILSNGIAAKHRGGVILRSCGKKYLKRHLKIDSDRFERLYPKFGGQAGMPDRANELHKQMVRPRDITPLPESILQWVMK
jgi:glycosyltransferase involved in cell wall biosynthesis